MVRVCPAMVGLTFLRPTSHSNRSHTYSIQHLIEIIGKPILIKPLRVSTQLYYYADRTEESRM